MGCLGVTLWDVLEVGGDYKCLVDFCRRLMLVGLLPRTNVRNLL